jgi:hypothetical protein
MPPEVFSISPDFFLLLQPALSDISIIRSVFSNNLEASLPLELTRRIVKLICESSLHAGLIMASRLSSSLDSISTSWIEEQDVAPGFPPPVLANLLSNFAEGLIRVTLNDLYLTDDALDALSRSKAASTIQKLSISNALITDASAHVWQRFSSLKVLSLTYCDLLDLETFVALSKHQVVEKLDYVSFESGSPTSCDLAPILLAPHSLPNLRSIQVSSSPIAKRSLFLPALLELIRQRPNRERLQELCYAPQMDDETDCLVELHQLCPNLESLCTILSPTQIPLSEKILQNLGNVRSLESMDLSIQSKEELFDLAKRFTSLETLQLGAFGSSCLNFPVGSFDAFSNLTSLDVKTSVVVPLHLPHGLKSLEYYAEDLQTPMAPEETNAFCDSICNSAPKLKRLVLVLPNSLDRRHVLFFLRRLPRLTKLSVGSSKGDTPQSESIEICHPNLSSLFMVLKHLKPVPAWWPKKTHFSVSGPVDPFNLLDHSHLPFLRSLNLSGRGSNFDAALPSVINVIRRYGHQIDSLILSTYDSFTQDSLNLLLSLRHLHHLELKDSSVNQQMAQSLIVSMPHLSKLGITVVVDTPDLSWLKMQRLRVLELTLLAPNEVDPTRPVDALILRPESLPLLSRLMVDVSSPVISAVRLSGFEHLSNLDISSSEMITLEIDIQRCQSLSVIEVSNVKIRSSQVSELPYLMKLHFMSCDLHEDATLHISTCPRLRSSVTCMTQSSGVEREKWEIFGKDILAQLRDKERHRFE